MNKEEFIKEVYNLGISLTEEQIKQFEIYLNFLKEYNIHTNLTTITNDKDIYLKHFYDSITIIKQDIIDLNKINTLVDVGTGAGFPGMVIKIIFPSIKVTLIDSNNKKIAFLKELVTKLKIKNIEILNVRSEEFALKNLDKYDVVTSRAVANMTILTELCLPMVKENGYFIALKANVEKELENANNIIKNLNGKLEKKLEFKLIKEDSVRNIIVIKKVGKNPKGYPRTYAKIKKEYEKSVF